MASDALEIRLSGDFQDKGRRGLRSEWSAAGSAEQEVCRRTASNERSEDG